MTTQKLLSLLLYYLLLVGAPVFAQEHLFKAIENGDYERVEEKLRSRYQKKPDDALISLLLARLYNSPGYGKHHPDTALYYLELGRKALSSLKPGEQLELGDTLQVEQSRLCLHAFTYYRGQQQLQAYEHLIQRFGFCEEQRQQAILLRNGMAFDQARKVHTVQAYEDFMRRYPQAVQYAQALASRNELAFEAARACGTIPCLEAFIAAYPQAQQLGAATDLRDELAYQKALSLGQSRALQDYMRQYPESKWIGRCRQIWRELLFAENTRIGNIDGYWNAYQQGLDQEAGQRALDSPLSLAEKTYHLPYLEHVASNAKGEASKRRAWKALYDYYAFDGERKSLDLFARRYKGKFPYGEWLDADLKIADQSPDMSGPYTAAQRMAYEAYIKQAAPRERAFLALQRMMEPDILSRDWQAARIKLDDYSPYFPKGDRRIRDLYNIIQAPEDPLVKAIPLPGEVNTSAEEYAPVISADGRQLFFCREDRPDSPMGEDIFVSKWLNTGWGKPQPVSALNTMGHDAPESISTDGTMLLQFEDGKVFYSEKTDKGWSHKSPLPAQVNTGRWVSDAMYTSDRQAIIFSAIRDGNYNLHPAETSYHGNNNYASDIYVCIKQEDGRWGNAINLGSVINTRFCDRSPFLHPDMKTLYFSSDGHGGVGDLDVYMSTRLSDTSWTQWSEPVNLGKQINTPGMDWGYRISTDGQTAYFASEVSGNQELYQFSLPLHLRPEAVSTLEGRLLGKDERPVEAFIRWEDLTTGRTIGEARSSPEDGSFYVVLPLGKIYGYYIDKEGVFPISRHLDLRYPHKPVSISENIPVVTFKEMIEQGLAMPVNNLFFPLNKSQLLPESHPELRRVARIIQTRGLQIQVAGHTDDTGKVEDNQLLSELRAQATRDFLIDQGCRPEQIQIIGYGATRPVAPNDSEADRAKNRRVEIRILKQK